MFALPVTILKNLPGQQRECWDIEEINWQAELKQIKDLLYKHGPKLSIMAKRATAQNLVDTLSQMPSILHISCHGIQTKSNTTKGKKRK